MAKEKDNEKLGCLMVDMPKEVDNVIKKFVSDNINDKEKLYYSEQFDYVQGIPENFHVTVKYGLYEINDSAIKELYRPIKFKLGKIDKFKQDDYDVLIVKIESEDLMGLNKKVCEEFENKTTFEYSPHLTLAYVTKGSYDNLVGKSISDSNNIITLGVDKYIYKPYKNDKGVNAMAHMTPEELDKWEKEYNENRIKEATEALQKGGYLITPKNIKTVIKYWAKGYAHATMPWPWDLEGYKGNYKGKEDKNNVEARTSDIGRKALLSDGNVGEVVKIYKTFMPGPNSGKDIPKYEYDMLVNGEIKKYPESQLEEWISANEEVKESVPKYNVGETVKVVKGENEGKEGEVLEVDIYTEDEGWKSNMIVPYVYFINFEGANKDNPNDWIMEEDIMGVNKVEGKARTFRPNEATEGKIYYSINEDMFVVPRYSPGDNHWYWATWNTPDNEEFEQKTKYAEDIYTELDKDDPLYQENKNKIKSNDQNINRKGIWASDNSNKIKLNDHIIKNGKEYMILNITPNWIFMQGFGTDEKLTMLPGDLYEGIEDGTIIMASNDNEDNDNEDNEFGFVSNKELRTWLQANGIKFIKYYPDTYSSEKETGWSNAPIQLTGDVLNRTGWFIAPSDNQGVDFFEVLGKNKEGETGDMYKYGDSREIYNKLEALEFIRDNISNSKKIESAKQSEQKFDCGDVVEIVDGEYEGIIGIIEDAEYDEHYWRDAGGEWVYTIENGEDDELIEDVAESDIKMAEDEKKIESAVRIPIEIKVYFEDSNKLNAIGKEFADSTLDYGAWVNVDISGEGGMSIEDAKNMISWDAEVYDINYNNYQPNLETEQDYVGDNVMDLIYTYYSSWFGLSTNKIKNIEVIFKGKVPGYDSSEQIKSKTKVKAEGNNENDNETVEVSNDEILEQFRKENTHKFRVYEDIRSGNEAPISKLKEVIQKGIEALDDYTMDNAAEYVGDIAYDTVENWLKEEGYTEVSDEVKDEMRWHIEELADYNIEDLFDYPVLLKKYYGEIYHEEGVVLSYDNVVWTDEANKWKAEALKYITQKDLERICNNSTYGGDAFVGGIVSGKEIIETIMKGEKEVQVDTIIIGIHDSANGSGFYEEGNGKLKINFDEAKLDVGSYSLGAVFGTGEWIYASINKNVQASRTKPNMHRLKKPVETLLKKRGVDFEVIDINQVTDDKVWVDVYYKDKDDYDMMVIERSQLNDNEVNASQYSFRTYHDGTPQEYREYKLPYKFNTIEELTEIAKGNEKLMEFLQGEMSTGDVILSKDGKEFVGIDIQDTLKKMK